MRQVLRDVINTLQKSKVPMTSKQIAMAMNVSQRSVKNYVSEINQLYDKKLIKSSRHGYELYSKTTFELILSSREEKIPQNNEERAFYIIKQLVLEHKSRLDLYQLCESLFISYSTLKSVITQMNKTFSLYNISFICEADYVYIEGKEGDIRKLISYTISEDSKMSYMDTSTLESSFKDVDIQSLIGLVTTHFKQYNYYLNDFTLMNMLVHLSIIIGRAKGGNSLSDTDIKKIYEDKRDEEVVLSLAKKMEKKFDISLNQSEINEIYILFKANVNYSLSAFDVVLEELISEDVILMTQEYIDKINQHYLLDLSSQTFMIPFALHLNNLLFRAKNKKYIKNPMTAAIKYNNPIVFDISIFVALDLMERFSININEDEIAFISMHIGAEIERQNQNKTKITSVLLYPQYHNMNQHVTNSLMLNFGNQINLIKTVYDIEELNDLKFDLLFSALPNITLDLDCPIIYISSFNIQKELEIIQDTIYQMKNAYQNNKLRNNFDSFFEEDLFKVFDTSMIKEEVIHNLSNLLIEKKYVNEDYEVDILKRENAATTAFNLLAIPHSMEMNAIKTSIAVGLSKEGITWGDNKVHLVLLLAINKADKKTFRELYESLINIFTEQKTIYKLNDCNNLQEFKKIIYDEIDS